MPEKDYPPEFVRLLKSVPSKRPRLVIQHILEHGHITTEELRRRYGYDHPPRGVRDVREQGIPLETFYVRSSAGKRIAAYRFADPRQVRRQTLAGRRVLSRKLKEALIAEGGCRCAICLTQYEGRYLQVDHRVPFEVAGNEVGRSPDPADFMLLCRACNRGKSWSCEHCPNWREAKRPAVCAACYWASPDAYSHIALRQVRRLEGVWTEKEVRAFDRLAAMAAERESELPAYVKEVLRKHTQARSRRG